MSRLRGVQLGAALVLGGALMCGTYGPAAAIGGVTTTPMSKAVPVPNILNNGQFALPAKYYSGATVPAGSSLLPGWRVGTVGTGSGGVQVYSSTYQGIQPPPGTTWMVKMSYFARGSVSQSVKTTAGWTYLLQWYESGYPNYGPPEFTSINWVKVVDVSWANKLVAAPSFNAKPNTDANMHWALRQEVLTATSSRTPLEFADATAQTSTGYAAFVGNVSLAGDAKFYLPAHATLAPTGKLVAVVQTATGYAFSDPSLTVKLYGTWKQKTTSYAPPTVVTKVIAGGPVIDGKAELPLHSIPASAVGQTISVSAVLAGPGFIPVTHQLTIKVS
ncbi:MAG: hypothetical protein ABSD97_15530 [Acidimicrobiales bacterium]